MTDANLMDADCIHGTAWYDCDVCWQVRDDEEWAELQEAERVYNSWCPWCKRDKFGPDSCECANHWTFGRELDLGIVRDDTATTRNHYEIFHENFVGLLHLPEVYDWEEEED